MPYAVPAATTTTTTAAPRQRNHHRSTSQGCLKINTQQLPTVARAVAADQRVAFPASSPPQSPPPRSAPATTRPTRPLKPSLKGALPPHNLKNHVRCHSAPATPSMNKSVHFADSDALESVVLFAKTAMPIAVRHALHPDEPRVPSPAELPPSPPNGLAMTIPSWLPQQPQGIQINTKDTSTIPRPLTPAHSPCVLLESINLRPVSPPSLFGSIVVRNIAFHKDVAVRFSLDGWTTVSEVLSSYATSLSTLPPLFSSTQAHDGSSWDRFTFRIRLDYDESALVNREMVFAIRYTLPQHGGEHWDNNEGKNYTLKFESIPAPAPIPSPAPAPAPAPAMFSSAAKTAWPAKVEVKEEKPVAKSRFLLPTPPDSPDNGRRPLPSLSATLPTTFTTFTNNAPLMTPPSADKDASLRFIDGMPASQSTPIDSPPSSPDEEVDDISERSTWSRSLRDAADARLAKVIPTEFIQRYCYFQPSESGPTTKVSSGAGSDATAHRMPAYVW